MGVSSSAINSTQDFLARMGGGRLFDMGTSAVKYGNNISISSNHRREYRYFIIIIIIITSNYREER